MNPPKPRLSCVCQHDPAFSETTGSCYARVSTCVFGVLAIGAGVLTYYKGLSLYMTGALWGGGALGFSLGAVLKRETFTGALERGNLEALPNEIIVKSLALLSHSDRAACRQTCRDLYQLGDDPECWREVNFCRSFHSSPPVQIALPRHANHIRSLSIGTIDMDSFNYMGQFVRSLTHLHALDMHHMRVLPRAVSAPSFGPMNPEEIRAMLWRMHVQERAKAFMCHSLHNFTDLRVLRLSEMSDQIPVLANEITVLSRLEALSLSQTYDRPDNSSCVPLVEALPQLPSLTFLSCSSMRFEGQNLRALCEALPQCGRLRALELVNDTLDDENVIELAPHLSSLSSLTSLCVDGFTTRGAVALGHALGSLTQLRLFRIKCHYIGVGTDGVLALLQGTMEACELEIFTLSTREMGSSVGTAIKEWLPRHPHLRELYVKLAPHVVHGEEWQSWFAELATNPRSVFILGEDTVLGDRRYRR